MIRINLLPHREEKRKQNKKAFVALCVMFAAIGAVIVLVVGGFFATRIGIQNQRNSLLEIENKALDEKIKEIASLKQDIEGLKARQQAVEDLQGDRNQPVYLMDELVKQTPDGVHFRSFKQEGQRIVMQGYAQSTERVSDLLRNFGNNSQWLERPELVVSSAVNLGAGKAARSVYDFTINVGIKRPRDKDKPSENNGKPGTPGAAAGAPGAAPASAASGPAAPSAGSGAAASAVASSLKK
ncbi:MAG: hypothetical protein RL748_1461 [Pseudomonadota bacterium]|jgi:type IV pilus assembly protein PilN